MTKMYKVIFNNSEVLVEAKKLNKAMIVQKKKITNKNKSEMHIIAEDVLSCLKLAREQFFKQFNYDAKSIEVSSPITNQISNDLREYAKTSESMIVNHYSQKVSA